MENFDKFILSNFLKEIKKQGYSSKVLVKDIWQFRVACYKFNYFMKHIALPKIKKKSFYEAVFIEFRILPHIEFIIRNAILKLGSEWSFTIICGIDNYEYMYSISKNIDKNINIICLDYTNLLPEDYNNLLTSESFWNILTGEKILIYQEDSLIFRNNIKPFLTYDFVGAPFTKSSNDTPNCVGNGGLSLRTKMKMIEIIKKFRLEDLKLNSSTIAYMQLMNLNVAPEDVYFSKNMQEFNIGDVADWDTAYKFSSEQVFNSESFGGHKFWISNKDWKTFLKKIFRCGRYYPSSNLDKFLKFKKLPNNFNRNDTMANAFDIDLEFFCRVNNIEYVNDLFTLEYISTISLDGFIYHPKQIYNIFTNLELYRFSNNIYSFYGNEITTIQSFVNKHLYNSTFDYMSDILIKKKYDILNDNYDTYILAFLGNEEQAINLLSKIISYKKINHEFNIAFCINRNSIKDDKNIKNIIKNNFDFYAIYYSKEMGTDITPTLLMYNDIIKLHSPKYIIKLHTKTISNLYNELTDYLMTTPFQQLQNSGMSMCNCVGNPNMYLDLNNDIYNNELKKKYKHKIHSDYFFVIGTIFYCENIVFDKVLEFVKNNNYRSYLLNNLYENNSINQAFSPIHFLERLFGVIKL